MSFGGWLDAALVSWAVAHLVATLFLAVEVRGRLPAGRVWALIMAGLAFAAGGGVARLVGVARPDVLVAVVAGWVLSVVVCWSMRGLSPAGGLVWSSFLLMGAALAVWGVRFLGSLHLTPVTLVCLWAATVVGAVTLPSSVLQTFEGWEILLRRWWSRPRDPRTDWRPQGPVPKVSIHVPVHAEPPELVMATLDSLARLDYPDFEVLVIDNNTPDPDLWQPVEQHCARLGSRFRFFQVEGLTGAKAGALNLALGLTDPGAQLVAVVDADYQVSPQWLAHTVGFFDDPEVGFVQCPHAYRDFEQSRFGRMADVEYTVFFATSMVSLSEHEAGITVGTMSLIRRAALDQVGGWAEWCLTEDSELAIRLHAAGYRSVYLSQPYGWGLIPQTFAAYKRQRFRWTYGPIQELRHHVRLFRPGPRRSASALGRRQRVHHANHGLDVAMIGLRLLVVPLGAAALVSMLWHHEIVRMPLPLWIAATVVLISSVWMRWLVFRHGVGVTLRRALGGVLAYLALTHIITVASLTALSGKRAPWQRTDKFKPVARRHAALAATVTETILAIGCLLAAAVAIVAMPHGGIALALALGLAWQGLLYAAAPVVAAVAERDLRGEITTADLNAPTLTERQVAPVPLARTESSL
jgi:cellulose synthase/poly-beta-1,6-N-acetylglucosamine synthase-like glycosyltransferase